MTSRCSAYIATYVLAQATNAARKYGHQDGLFTSSAMPSVLGITNRNNVTHHFNNTTNDTKKL
ncbi:MAG: hypothetical protein J6S67_00305 [Methanobrevibacter sp.]|nr:hypothetical protein [Methanobrevibacter sp.]